MTFTLKEHIMNCDNESSWCDKGHDIYNLICGGGAYVKSLYANQKE